MQAANAFRFYFSFRSPFAGIALYRLRRAAQFSEFDIELIPVWPDIVFGGHMDNPTDNLFKMAYIFGDASRQAEEAGLSPIYFRQLAKHFVLPVNVDYTKQKVGIPMPQENWALTHHAFNYAQQEGKAWAFSDAVFIRRFSFDEAGSEDVLNVDVLKSIAPDVGLDPEKTVAASNTGEFDALQTTYVRQSERDGVFGVPFFAIDRDDGTEVFWGNDRLAFLLKSLTAMDKMPVVPPVQIGDIQSSRL